MDSIDKLEQKLDKLDNRLDNIDVTLAAQHVSLKEHIRRTELLEEQVEPIKKHVNMVNGAMKFIGLATTLFAVIETVLKISGKI